MAIQIRMRRTELSEGQVVTIDHVDSYEILDDNTIELRKTTRPGKYKVVGHVNPHNWEIVLSDDESLNPQE